MGTHPGWDKVRWMIKDWPNKRSVIVEQSIKFVNDEVIFPSNPITELIQGENNLLAKKKPTNLQHDLETKSLENEKQAPENENENHEDNLIGFVTNNPNNFDSQTVIDFVTDKQNQQQVSSDQITNTPEVPQNPVTNKSQSRRTRIPTRYVREIQRGVRTTDGRSGRTNLPTGMQMPRPTTQVEGETEDTGQIKHAMVAATSEIEAIDPLSLEEAMR